ncbi:hypothetical protein RGB72_07170 [Glutamicibacter protophormiae]|uniref:hypothetical protein n=1 Tax=Kocuria TaxID=57493 RepID=UPI0006D78602|nr:MULTISPECIES: hypothetical protein [Kocuria]MDN5630745.1 hypothetical protein [Kocuria sp.]RUP83204.1 hypothetical protein D8M39_07830 [Kocuria sp. HSID17590]WNB87792.1 hypothetical protein RGB72_07170 [Glutamicibacter protophormiae]
MTLNVTPSGNRQSWDARVRVTGGHPDLLWGIGEAEALTRDDVRVQRVAVDRGNQTVGYGQLLVYPEDRHTVVDAKSLHVKNPRDLVAVLAALQEHSRTVHDAAVLRVSPDTHATTELADELAEAGYRRRDKPRRGEAGPRHLVVRLGETEGELSKRLSSETLQRCRAGLRDSGVRVRRVNASDRDLSHVGLRTQHIRELLRAVGENSVFLVATERPEDGPEKALGYLWFVHTGESAMIYRLGFTDRARELGVDDALLLTGLVQLQQRLVHKVLAGDPDQPGQPMVLRELATEDVEVLGTWEYPLVGEFQIAGRAEKTRRRVLGRRSRRARREEILPEAASSADESIPAPPAASEEEAVRAGRDDAAGADRDDAVAEAAETGAVDAGFADGGAAGTGAAPGNDAVDVAEPGAAPSRKAAKAAKAESRAAKKHTRSVKKVAPVQAAKRTRRGKRRGQPESGATGPAAGTTDTTAPETQRAADGLLRRALAEGRAAVRDAARW